MEFWKLILKEIWVLEIIWELEFWKLNLKEIGVLKINWELEFWKLIENWSFKKIKFKNWSLEN